MLQRLAMAMLLSLVAPMQPLHMAVHAAAPSRNEEAGPVGPCIAGQICQFDDPEDLADLRGTDWIIISQEAKDGLSGVTAWNVVNGDIRRYRQEELGPACLPDGKSGGIGVRRGRDGYALAHILHAPDGGADHVEMLHISVRRGVPILHRTACIPAPVPYFLNDIAPDATGGFFATHMFDRSRPRSELDADFRAARPTGFVVRWSVRGGWSRVPGTDGTFPNGIDLSSDGRWIAFAEIYGHALNHVRTDGRRRRRISLAMQPDNVTAAGRNAFIVAGGIGTPITSTRNCPALRRPGCGFPARAILVDFDKNGRQDVLVSSGGEAVPGISVALQKGNALYLGTAFGDRITKWEPAAGSPLLP